MENNRKSNKKFPFEGANPLAVWSIHDNLEQLQEIKKILQEKTDKKWFIFSSTTVVMILLSIMTYIYIKDLIVFIIIIIVFIYILYIQLNRIKRLKYLKLDLNSRIEQIKRK